MARFYGKYRAVVVDTKDPQKMGRIRVKCPSVMGENISTWCLPCFPSDYFSIPKVGTVVWVEFEGGSRERPIWLGVMYTPEQIKVKFGSSYSPTKTSISGSDNVEIKAGGTITTTERWRG